MFVGKPVDAANYEKHTAGELTVYLPKDALYNLEGVKIDFVKEAGSYRLKVEGLKTIPHIIDAHKEVSSGKARRLLK